MTAQRVADQFTTQFGAFLTVFLEATTDEGAQVPFEKLCNMFDPEGSFSFQGDEARTREGLPNFLHMVREHSVQLDFVSVDVDAVGAPDASGTPESLEFTVVGRMLTADGEGAFQLRLVLTPAEGLGFRGRHVFFRSRLDSDPTPPEF